MTNNYKRKTNKGKRLTRTFGLFGSKTYVKPEDQTAAITGLVVTMSMSLGMMTLNPIYDYMFRTPVNVQAQEVSVAVDQLQEVGAGQTLAPEPLATDSAELSERVQILSYIVEVFGDDAHKAIAMLATCENGGLDPYATNHNRNGTIDRGVFQINSIHGGEEMFDWKTNVDKAYEIYSDHDNSFYAWTCGNVAGDRTYVDAMRGR